MFAARELSNTLASLPEFQKGDYGEAMRLAFLQIDEKIQTPAGLDWLRSNRDREPRPITQELKNIEEQIGVKVSKLMQKAQDEDGNAGCTAVAVLLVEEKIGEQNFRVLSEMRGMFLYYNPKNFKKSHQNQPKCRKNAVKI